MKRKIIFCFLILAASAVVACFFLDRTRAEVYVSDEKLLERAALIYVKFGGEFIPTGSAVVISSRLALTARHVIDPYRIERKAIKIGILKKFNLNIPEITEGELFLSCLGVKRGYKLLNYHDCEYVDLALLILDEPIPSIKVLKISGNIKEGDKTRIVGFPGNAARPELRYGVAKITRYYGLRIETIVRIKNGISGSGVYNSRGELIGILRGVIRDKDTDSSGFVETKFISELLKKSGIDPSTLEPAK